MDEPGISTVASRIAPWRAAGRNINRFSSLWSAGIHKYLERGVSRSTDKASQNIAADSASGRIASASYCIRSGKFC